MAKQKGASPDRDAARKLLDDLWATVLADDSLVPPEDSRALVNSKQTSIRFCLPTQLLGKMTDNRLDALCLQKGRDPDPARWDPRGFATAVIVPWNRDNQAALGPSGDPYVSNPLRRPRVDSGLGQMADRAEWMALCAILHDAQTISKPEHTEALLKNTLVAIRDRMRDLNFVYVVPERVSLSQATKLVCDFLSERSGGDRGLSVAAALFETIKDGLGIYTEIRRGMINAADASMGAAGDLECIGQDSKIALAVEVKEREIKVEDVQASIAKVRELGIRELLFCCDGVLNKDREAVERLFASAWASGTNLYSGRIDQLMGGILPILGEKSIHAFIVAVGAQLDKFSTQPRHRKAWKLLLDRL
jgi:hypothetical protein